MREQRRVAARLPQRLTMAHGLMVLAGLVTFVSVSATLADRSATAQVAVARDDLAAGQVLSSADLVARFDVVDVHADSPLLDGVADPTSMLEGQLARDLASGEALRSTDIVPVAEQSVARTITLPVDAVVLTGLGLTLNDSIDVIGLDPNGELSFVVIDAAIARLPGEQTSSGAFAVRQDSFVTIRVSDTEALAVAAALRAGDIEIVRSTGAAPLGVTQ